MRKLRLWWKRLWCFHIFVLAGRCCHCGKRQGPFA